MVRQPTPPSCFAGQRAPTRERQLPVTTSPHRRPANPRIEADRSVAPQTRTATGDTAKKIRQVGPPSDTAKLHRRSESAKQRAPTAGDHHTPPATCRSSHRSLPISRGSNPHRNRRDRQLGPPNDTAKLLRESESANQRAPTAGDVLTPSATCRSSHRSVLICRGSKPHRHRPRPPTRSAKSLREMTPPVRERQPPVTTSPHRASSNRRIEACRSVAAQTRTATGRHRQRGPPCRSAN